jgi:hypothetical protein
LFCVEACDSVWNRFMIASNWRQEKRLETE